MCQIPDNKLHLFLNFTVFSLLNKLWCRKTLLYTLLAVHFLLVSHRLEASFFLLTFLQSPSPNWQFSPRALYFITFYSKVATSQKLISLAHSNAGGSRCDVKCRWQISEAFKTARTDLCLINGQIVSLDRFFLLIELEGVSKQSFLPPLQQRVGTVLRNFAIP